MLVHGTVETETWTKDGEPRSRDVVVVSERYGEIGASLRFTVARSEKANRQSTDTNH